ncbi:MAG: flagellar export chaperone FliS [Thermodesulfobacteriota bacterium]|nr:flagellar export chaperone FliS [Thermodesulfobacteriota bacterium]
MNVNGYQAYKKTQIQTADQGTLILMCYNGAITFLKQAKQAIENKDDKNRSTLFTKAQKVIWELNNSLNYEAGDVAYKLDALYHYMIRRIIEADYNENTEAIDEVVGHLEEIRESWETIIQKTR